MALTVSTLVALFVIFNYGTTGLYILFGCIVVAHVGYRLKTGRWMELH